MAHYAFVWNEAKAVANEKKHGVSFAEAATVFADQFAVESYDIIHSHDEDRFVMLGRSDHNRILVVAFTVPDYKTIRVISARPATRRERFEYEKESRY